MENQNLIPFEGKEIRKAWHGEQWYFSIIDVIEVLTDSPSPKTYWAKLKAKEQKASGQTFPFTEQLKMKATDGRSRLTDCANTEGILRIVMSVPSPKAEPIRLWLAQVGKERFEEMEQPEIGIHRNLEYYKAKGYTDEWIKNRLETITTRNKLTDEWKNREVKEGKEYSILTAIIAKGTFGLFPSEHKKLKGLTKPSQDLRDNMTALELIFTQLGEETTRQLAVKENAQGFEENKDKAVKGGKATGVALDTYETQTGLKVVSSENFLPPSKGTDTLPDSTEPKE
jgi:DNA-damage-inducible protein D